MIQQEATRAGAVSWLHAGGVPWKRLWAMKTSIRALLWEKEICPPSSPDCSPLDFFAWGVFEWRVRAKPRNKSPSPGTSWRTPARGSGPRLRLSSLLMVVLLTKLILSMFLCQPVFTSMKLDGFQLCCVILKKRLDPKGIPSSASVPSSVYVWN